MFLEYIKFIVYSGFIVLISKYILVTTLRKLAESLDLKPKLVGDISGYATSIPELLTIGVSSFNGLIGASLINILSSNIINVIQYISSIILNKNQKAFKNKAIQIDIVMVLGTIIIPIILLILRIEVNISIIPIFLILYLLFKFINNNAHKLYLKNEENILERQIKEEEKWKRNNRKNIIRYALYLLITGILLFIIGNALGNTLENLCRRFNVPEIIIGILLGFITSIPELITFFESQRHYKKQKKNDILGVVESTNNLLTSNIVNIFVIQSIGSVIYAIFA